MTPKAYSAPGKALIAGGYLVLDPHYNSYVTALSSRMHAVVNESQQLEEQSQISVKSPQFNGQWTYEIESNLVEVAKSSSYNPFLEATVSTVLKYIQPTSKFNIEVTIYSDPGFHSQENTQEKTSANGKKRFLYHQQAIHEVAKTGLGSSAGLVTVVTAALLGYFQETVSQNTLHNAAQVGHCIAQKKIGSGFDVAAAVYGSIVYRRFDPELITAVVSEGSTNLELAQLIDSDWNFNHTPCTLPPHIKILMGDIQGGSETPKLVSKVLQWKKDQPEESAELYSALNQANQDLMNALRDLHVHYAEHKAVYLEGVAYLKDRTVSGHELYLGLQPALKAQLAPFLALINSVKEIRSNLRKLTRACGAEIEPVPQTLLLNNCNTLKGNLGGVVPGAGGYDAISLLVIDESIESIVETTSSDPRFASVSWLDLHEQKDGLVEESVDDYEF